VKAFSQDGILKFLYDPVIFHDNEIREFIFIHLNFIQEFFHLNVWL